MAAVAWDIASVDEKQSRDGLQESLQAHLAGVCPADGAATGLAQGMVPEPKAETALPEHATVKSSPAVLPQLDAFASTRDLRDGPVREAMPQGTFALTTLINVLPQALPALGTVPPAPVTDETISATVATLDDVAAQVPTGAGSWRRTVVAAENSAFEGPTASAAARTLSLDPHRADTPAWRRRTSPATATATPAVPRSLLSRLLGTISFLLRFGAIAFAAWLFTVFILIAAFRTVDPPQSMLMFTQRLSGVELTHTFVPLEAISTNLRRAVITAEDGKFCKHWGFDIAEIQAAMRSTDSFGRGASTITQQLAKNLFLWNGKSYVRKALEVPLTLAIEGMWSKRRILEVYLNIVEWGPGVFGAEAAARYHFDTSASQLTEREASLLAVSLPNPIARDAANPDPAIAKRAARIQSRMRVQGVSYCTLTPLITKP